METTETKPRWPTTTQSSFSERALAALGQHPLTASASPHTRRALAGMATWRELRKGEVLFHQGKDAHQLALVCAGTARLTRWGCVLSVTGYRGAGEVVGEEAVGAVLFRSHSTEAATALEVLCLPGEAVAECVVTDKVLGRAVLALLVARSVEVEDGRQDAFALTVEQRLAKFLSVASARWGTQQPGGAVLIDARLSHAEIACSIGATRETVTLVLGKLRRAGILATRGRHLVVVDGDALTERMKGGP
jgi:CRP/FNR family cyclic AMP-dependent transcriptional regulator